MATLARGTIKITYLTGEEITPVRFTYVGPKESYLWTLNALVTSGFRIIKCENYNPPV
jgi:hypothetical protein